MAIDKTIVVCLDEAFEALVMGLTHRSNYASDDEEELNAIQEIFKSIVDSLLDKSKEYNQVIQTVIHTLEQADYSKAEARSILDICIALVINKLTELLPEFNDDKRQPHYTYVVRQRSLLIITFLS
jgi:predicted patatin/cPLA2 family phospholipase